MCEQKSRDMGSGHLVVIPHSIGNPYIGYTNPTELGIWTLHLGWFFHLPPIIWKQWEFRQRNCATIQMLDFALSTGGRVEASKMVPLIEHQNKMQNWNTKRSLKWRIRGASKCETWSHPVVICSDDDVWEAVRIIHKSSTISGMSTRSATARI